MGAFTDYLNEEGVDYILIEMPESIFENLEITTESYQQDSFHKNYKYRVDVATDHTQQKHVHIAKNKHINSKNQQASWNIDGSRHDKKSFNVTLGSNKKVQDIAKKALNLNTSIALESYEESEIALEHLSESMEYNPIKLKVVI